MKRPPKKYVCEKCGYLGDTSEHEGCDYLAWITGEQLCIDQLERELALLKASPASAPEGWKWRRHARTRWEAVGHWDSIEEMAYNDMLGRGWDVEKLYSHAAPTPPVHEDRKDAERYRWLRKEWFREDEENSWFMQSESSFLESPDEFDAAIDAAMEGK